MKARIKAGIDAIVAEKELLLNSGMVFGASFLGAIFMFVANIILSRHFGPELFGNFKTVVSLFLLVPVIVDFGTGYTLTKHIAEFSAKNEWDKINYLFRWFLKMRLVLYLISMVLLFSFRNSIASFFLKDASLVNLIIPGILITAFSFFEVFKAVPHGFQNFGVYSSSFFLTSLSIGVLTVLAGVYFGVYYAILAWALSYIIGNIPAIIFLMNENRLKKGNGHPVTLDVKKIFVGYSLPVYSLVIPGFIGSGIIPILSSFFAQTSIGYYAFSYSFYAGIILIPTAITSAIFPKLSEFKGDLKKVQDTLKRVVAAYSLIAGIGIVGCLLFSRSIISKIAPMYLPGLPVFNVLVPLGFVFGFMLIYESYLNASNRLKELMVVTTVRNVLLLIASFLALAKIS